MSTALKSRRQSATASPGELIPASRKTCERDVGGYRLRLSNLHKVFWPDAGVTKGDLLRYYAGVSEWILPHLEGRAVVMLRHPDGVGGKSFYMKRTPSYAPDWLPTCAIEHRSGTIEFPRADHLAALLWIVNLGCIDLHPWYSRCESPDLPDFLNFDLDPGPGSSFAQASEAALLLRDALRAEGIEPYVKTSGSKGIHVYVPIQRGPTQKQVWSFAKTFGLEFAARHPGLLTAEYRKARRPRGRILVDYNQNAGTRTLASIYSVRPRTVPSVSVPLEWKELERGVRPEEFRIENVPARLREKGDLWRDLLSPNGRVDLAPRL